MGTVTESPSPLPERVEIDSGLEAAHLEKKSSPRPGCLVGNHHQRHFSKHLFPKRLITKHISVSPRRQRSNQPKVKAAGRILRQQSENKTKHRPLHGSFKPPIKTPTSRAVLESYKVLSQRPAGHVFSTACENRGYRPVVWRRKVRPSRGRSS